MTTSETDHKHPYYRQISKLEKPITFFEEDPERLAYVSLGEALDFLSAGAMNYVLWPNLEKRAMVRFIETWMKNQKPRIQYDRIPDPKIEGLHTIKEKSREFFYLWNRFHEDFPVSLPFINLQHCTGEGHRGTIKDRLGRIRCLHVEKKKIKPSFSVEYRVGDRVDFQDDEPMDPSLFDYEDCRVSEEELERYEKLKEKYEGENPVTVLDPCYTIISDVGTNIPLENILYRLDVSGKFSGPVHYSVYPFSGFELANYVKAWWEQPGEKRLFKGKGVREDYRVFPNFQPVSD